MISGTSFRSFGIFLEGKLRKNIENCDISKVFFNPFHCRQMSNIVLKFNKELTGADPQNHPVLIIGQLRHLSVLQFDQVKIKFGSRVTEDTFQNAITCLHPSPTDFCPLYLDLATIAALPIKCSRHNTTSRAHAVTRLVKTHAMNVHESVLVGFTVVKPTQVDKASD